MKGGSLMIQKPINNNVLVSYSYQKDPIHSEFTTSLTESNITQLLVEQTPCIESKADSCLSLYSITNHLANEKRISYELLATVTDSLPLTHIIIRCRKDSSLDYISNHSTAFLNGAPLPGYAYLPEYTSSALQL